jgi:PAS domain S-box-containing protein
MVATALPVMSLLWASGVFRVEVEQRALEGLVGIAKATVQQQRQAWDDAHSLVTLAANNPPTVRSVRSTEPETAAEVAAIVFNSGPFAGVRIYDAAGILLGAAGTPVDGPLPAGQVGAPAAVGGPVVAGDRTTRQVSFPISQGTSAAEGRLVADVDLSQLLGDPQELGFGRTGARFLVTREGMIVAGPTAVDTRLRSQVNLEIVDAGVPATKTIFSPLFSRSTVESYEPVPGQDLGVLVQQARSEVMAGADRLTELLRVAAALLIAVGATIAASLMVILNRRARREESSERRRTEESRRAEAMFQGLLESAPDAIVVMGSDGLIKLVNRQTEVLFGYDRDELLGQPVELLIPERLGSHHPELRDGYFSMPSVRAMGAGLELAARRKDGSEFPVDISLAPLETDEGILVSAAVRDITERKRAEAKFQGLLESAPDAIVVVGADGLIRLVNRQTEVMFGYSRDELVGEPVERLIPERLAAHHPNRRSGYFTAPAVRAMGANLELAARRKDGSEFPVDISLSPLETEEGVLVSAAVRDVTERKRAEEELREREEQLAAARDEALEASRLKSQFLANMSHEIRTPMNGVLGMAELILTDELPPGQRARMINLKESGQSLLTIINDILDFSKMEAGKLELEEETFDLKASAESVLSLLSAGAASRGIELTLNFDPGAPQWVRGDSVRFRQILLNLAGNGLKFTRQGGVTVDIAPADERIRVCVTDTGIGIDPVAKERLLEPFSQGDASTTRQFGGTGLGLAICNQLIHLMGGTMDFVSEPGYGTRFWFEVELPPAEPPAAVALQPGPELPAGRSNGGDSARQQGRILLVDDVAVNRIVAQGLLESLGYEVQTVESGAEALAKVGQGDFLAVLMDCLMPEMDGYETTRRIRALGGPVKTIPIIALTAAAMSGDRERCLESGMDDYISKPLDLISLKAALDRQTTRRSSGTAAAVPDPLTPMRETLAGFRERFPVESFENICREFLSSTPRLLADLEAAVMAGDSDSVRSLAHKLKGGMGTFGADGMAETAQQLQTGPSASMAAHALVEQLKADYQGAAEVVRAHLSEKRTP